MLEYILGTLTDADIEWLSDHGEPRTLAAGEQVVSEGEETPGLFLILEGELHRVGAGPPPERLGPGELAGLIPLLDGGAAPASFAAEGETVVLALAQADVRDRLALDIGFAARFYRALGVLEAGRWRAEYAAERGQGEAPPPLDGVNAGLVEDRMRRLLRRLDPCDDIVITGDDLTVEQVARVA